MLKKNLIFLLIIILVGIAGYFIFQNSLVFSEAPKTPTSTVKAFYETWTNYDGEDILEGSYRENNLITPSFIEAIETAESYDPVLCAQDIPTDFEVQQVSKSTSSSVVQVREFFEGSVSSHEVRLIKEEKWLINKVVCFPVAKQVFSETGNLTKDLPGLEADVWFLSYEKPGQPGLAVKLKFDQESSCSFEENEGSCKEILNEDLVGTRVKVEGEKTEGKVLVKQLSEQ